MKTSHLLTCTALLISTLGLNAQTITFLFGSSSGQAASDLNGLVMGSTTSSGLTLTGTALGPTGSSFNATGSGFGINNDQNASTDDSDGFDLTEGFTFSFDSAITIDSITVSSVNPADQVRVTFPSLTPVEFPLTSGTTPISSGIIAANQVISLETIGSAGGGNGWELESVTVSAVPEPATYALLSGVAIMGFAIYRRRCKR